MRRLFFITAVMIGLASLTGCSFMGSYMNNVSTKHDGSLINNGSNQAAAASAKQCNQWCHNGWCSTHCESPTTTGN